MFSLFTGTSWSRPVTPGVGRSWNLVNQDSEAQVAMHHESEWEPRPERESGGEVYILGKKIESFWPFLDGLIQISAELLLSQHS
jgi:hypothetical protein